MNIFIALTLILTSTSCWSFSLHSVGSEEISDLNDTQFECELTSVLHTTSSGTNLKNYEGIEHISVRTEKWGIDDRFPGKCLMIPENFEQKSKINRCLPMWQETVEHYGEDGFIISHRFWGNLNINTATGIGSLNFKQQHPLQNYEEELAVELKNCRKLSKEKVPVN